MRRLLERLGLMDGVWLTGRGIVVVVLVFMAVVFSVVAGVSWTVESRNCAYASRQYQLRTHYDRWAGCYITTPSGRSIPVDQYRAVIDK